MKPLAIDLFCGSFAWSAGWTELGGRVIGFDIDHQPYHGPIPQNASLVLQDVRTINGAQFKDASLILASPPCQEFSYMAMPWTRAKRVARALRGEGAFPDDWKGSRTVSQLRALFDACFRIQREASEAAGRYIPLVVENVRGIQPWVGCARWHHGSYYLFGDVPALMPITLRAGKSTVGSCARLPGANGGRISNWPHDSDSSPVKVPGLANGQFPPGGLAQGYINNAIDAVKIGGSWFHDAPPHSLRVHSSKSSARKAASARIAMIPLALSRHIARTYFPVQD